VGEAEISITEGVKQGCPLSPTLFTLFIDRLEAWLEGQIDAADR
jgi:hypothetical protein